MRQESSSSEIVLEGDDPKVLHAMLDWCYHGKVDTVVDQYGKPKVKTFATLLFQTADKYDISALKDEIEKDFSMPLKSAPPFLVDNNSESVLDLVEALRLMYEMPEAVTEDLRRCFFWGLGNFVGNCIEMGWFQNLFFEQPAIARDLLDMVSDGELGSKLCKYECRKCRRTWYMEYDECENCPVCKHYQVLGPVEEEARICL